MVLMVLFTAVRTLGSVPLMQPFALALSLENMGTANSLDWDALYSNFNYLANHYAVFIKIIL